ncbi:MULTISPECIES: uroporphyrinogen-III C-methyltransferase [unclassified Candidatus Frackibacter]|uniref:uroporphyrinogen-III C-methyltransferase n=1 Tax=unclassified Candidatus Frackibacter TaxID=2648818 RepID=UPI00079B0757|nr:MULTISPECIES: uroporphyrinogen-III C-methyltransferase [unclassified Candidatus Frackibacter]KXS44737.1 MAG: uroporphyrinogen III methyltransferase / synthase [Candidatus Frackibacter sp. T328-2]SDC41228.1 uroporphyrinogen III methyltransferase / synthase [Candidatus Frackibacter sp. WG11]SEM59691.1 uroporphyrinogen III methyltransferase / synthase [Candidatus Frackibacter sp. WG12]SFL62377.1 uroporphyrinogen III methyltransferase / synthase [Candidatus Frackibacter sp. WG13]
MEKGKVFLIGAGPGDPKLITVKGLEAIEEADVLVYDYLANPMLLEDASPEVEKIYVGKKAGNHTYSQEEINDIIVEKAKEGKIVTRLKGGDPFIFGRGGEEAEYLRDNGVEFEIVPGITSPIAVPAYAGIPLTHRDFNSSVAFVTGHEDPTKDESNIDWEKLSTATGTIVFLMGVGNLPNIVEQLKKHGRSPDTSVALIRWGTRPEQETVVGNLDNIVQKVKEAGLKPPAITLVGDVVQLRDRLQWFDNKPLFSKRVLVTRSRTQASRLSKQLYELGAQPVECPAIKIVAPEDINPLDASLAEADKYDWIVFTSVNGVKAVVNRLKELDKDVRALGDAKICAIGSKTAEEIENSGLRVDYIPEKYVAESILDGLEDDLSGQKFLLPRADIAREALPAGLKERGAEVENVVAYRTVTGEGNEEALRLVDEREVDVVTFTSSSTVRNFVKMLGDRDYKELLSETTIACIGPITAKTAKELGLEVDIVADEYTINGLVEALLQDAQ